MRINQFLARCDLGSRRKVEQLVRSRRIKINNQVAELHYEVKRNDIVKFDEKEIKIQNYVYYLLYKPVGYTATVSDPYAEKVITSLIADKTKIFPVGRLDRDSEGLIILTNDGQFAQKLAHPRHHIEKEYLVEARGPKNYLSEAMEKALKYFRCGILLDMRKTQRALAKIIGSKGNQVSFQIILREGRRRQIRRTLAKAGFEVISLKRIRLGAWKIGSLKPGQFRKISPDGKKLDK